MQPLWRPVEAIRRVKVAVVGPLRQGALGDVAAVVALFAALEMAMTTQAKGWPRGQA